MPERVKRKPLGSRKELGTRTSAAIFLVFALFFKRVTQSLGDLIPIDFDGVGYRQHPGDSDLPQITPRAGINVGVGAHGTDETERAEQQNQLYGLTMHL